MITRNHCCLFGAMVFAGGVLASGAVALGILWMWQRSDVAITKELRWLMRALYVLLGFSTVLGAASGVNQYLRNNGTERERAGEERFQIGIWLTLHFCLLPTMLMFLLPGLFLGFVVAKITKTPNLHQLVPYEPALFFLMLFGLLFLLRVCVPALAPEYMLLSIALAATCASDMLVDWYISHWHDQNRLAEAREAVAPFRFSLRSLMITVLSWGAYLTGLVWVFRATQ